MISIQYAHISKIKNENAVPRGKLLNFLYFSLFHILFYYSMTSLQDNYLYILRSFRYTSSFGEEVQLLSQKALHTFINQKKRAIRFFAVKNVFRIHK